jgi:hypothetical protein
MRQQSMKKIAVPKSLGRHLIIYNSFIVVVMLGCTLWIGASRSLCRRYRDARETYMWPSLAMRVHAAQR